MKIKVINFGYDKLPERAHYNDAGADVRACFHNGITARKIRPHETAKIPLGLGLVLPDGIAAFVFPRSGLSSRGITCELPPIDSGYRGEIHAIVTNHSDEDYLVKNGDRIGQLVVIPALLVDFYDESCGDYSERGVGAFGSTGL